MISCVKNAGRPLGPVHSSSSSSSPFLRCREEEGVSLIWIWNQWEAFQRFFFFLERINHAFHAASSLPRVTQTSLKKKKKKPDGLFERILSSHRPSEPHLHPQIRLFWLCGNYSEVPITAQAKRFFIEEQNAKNRRRRRRRIRRITRRRKRRRRTTTLWQFFDWHTIKRATENLGSL